MIKKLLVLVIWAGVLLAQTKTAEEAFKNIQTLKTMRSDQLIPSMQFISASLGVECAFCHVRGKMTWTRRRRRRPQEK